MPATQLRRPPSPPRKGFNHGLLDALCAIVATAQAMYYEATKRNPEGPRYFRCFGPDYKLDRCNAVLGSQLPTAQVSGFRVDTWKGGAGNGDGDGFSCSATFGTEGKRLPPTKRAGRDGKPPTTNHLAAHGWREVAAEAVVPEGR